MTQEKISHLPNDGEIRDLSLFEVETPEGGSGHVRGRALRNLAARRSVLVNNSFQVWPIGDGPHLATASKLHGPTGWLVSKFSGGTSGYQCQKADGHRGPAAIRVQRIAGTSDTGAIVLSTALERGPSAKFSGLRPGVKFGYRMGNDFNAANLDLRVYYHVTGAEQSVTYQGVFASGSVVLGAMVLQAPATVNWAEFQQLHPTAFPAGITQVLLHFRYTPADDTPAGADDWFELELVDLYPGSEQLPVPVASYEEDEWRCLRYAYPWKLTVGSTGQPHRFARPRPMRAVPTTAAKSGGLPAGFTAAGSTEHELAVAATSAQVVDAIDRAEFF